MQFDNCTIQKNMALNVKVAEFFDSANAQIIKNSTIHSNILLTEAQALAEIKGTVGCSNLCTLSEKFKAHIIANPNILKVTPYPVVFKVIVATLQIEQNTRIFNESAIIEGFTATIDITDSKLEDSKVKNKAFLDVTQTTLRLTRSYIQNLTPDNGYEAQALAIRVGLSSVIDFKNSFMQTLSIPAVVVRSSQIKIIETQFKKITA